jgi:hypothetical protein
VNPAQRDLWKFAIHCTFMLVGGTIALILVDVWTQRLLVAPIVLAVLRANRDQIGAIVSGICRILGPPGPSEPPDPAKPTRG